MLKINIPFTILIFSNFLYPSMLYTNESQLVLKKLLLISLSLTVKEGSNFSSSINPYALLSATPTPI